MQRQSMDWPCYFVGQQLIYALMPPHTIQAGKALGDNSQFKMRLPCPTAMQVAFILNQLVTRAIFLVQFPLDRCLNIHTPLFIYLRAIRYRYG